MGCEMTDNEIELAKKLTRRGASERTINRLLGINSEDILRQNPGRIEPGLTRNNLPQKYREIYDFSLAPNDTEADKDAAMLVVLNEMRLDAERSERRSAPMYCRR